MKKKVNEEGVALVWAIFLLIIVSALSIVLHTYNKSNALGMINQSNRLSALYFAESGIEFANSALYTKVNGVQLINDLDNQTLPLELHHTYKEGTNDIANIDVSIDIKTEDHFDWIYVESTGTLLDSGVSQTTILKISKVNPLRYHREFK